MIARILCFLGFHERYEVRSLFKRDCYFRCKRCSMSKPIFGGGTE